MSTKAEQVAESFFKSLMHNQCNFCWSLLSGKSQQEFLKWTMNDIYQRHPEAAKAAKIGAKEVRLLFENNDLSVMKSFWKRFFYKSNANDFFRYGYYHETESAGRQAVIQVTFKYPDGQTRQVNLTMSNERGGWKLAYLESGLPF